MNTPEMQLTVILTIVALWYLERFIVQRRARWLRQMPYDEYIKTPEWKARSARMKQKAGGRCRVCNSPHALDTHHRTYERLGYEDPEDLTVLCRDCHQLFSENGRLYKLHEGEREHPELRAMSSKTW